MWNERDRGELLFLWRGLAAWISCALVLLLLCSLLIWKSRLDSSNIGYLSSLISFLTAVVSGFSATRCRKHSYFSGGLICALTLVAALLSTGFLIEGESMSAGAVISVASISIAGVMLGSCVIFPLVKGSKQGRQHARASRPRKLT